MNLSPTLERIALTPWDRIRLFGSGVLRFRPGSCPPPETGGKHYTKIAGSQYGKITEVARRVIKGEFPGMTYPQIASQEGVDSESLKAAVWRLRKRAEKGRTAA